MRMHRMHKKSRTLLETPAFFFLNSTPIFSSQEVRFVARSWKGLFFAKPYIFQRTRFIERIGYDSRSTPSKLRERPFVDASERANERPRIELAPRVTRANRARIYRAFSESATAVASSRRVQPRTRCNRTVQHACLCFRRAARAFVASCSSRQCESVRSRGDTLNIIDTSVCNDDGDVDDGDVDNDGDDDACPTEREHRESKRRKRPLSQSPLLFLVVVAAAIESSVIDTRHHIDHDRDSDASSRRGSGRARVVPAESRSARSRSLRPAKYNERRLAIISVFAAARSCDSS